MERAEGGDSHGRAGKVTGGGLLAEKFIFFVETIRGIKGDSSNLFIGIDGECPRKSMKLNDTTLPLVSSIH